MYCEINIDDCAPDSEGDVPCKNDGKCFDGVNKFMCDCQGTGYTGVDCSYDVNECKELNVDCGHGTCENLPGFYRCICDKGYCGSNCGMENPCQEVSQKSTVDFFSVWHGKKITKI